MSDIDVCPGCGHDTCYDCGECHQRHCPCFISADDVDERERQEKERRQLPQEMRVDEGL